MALIEAGSFIDYPDEDGWTPLLFSVKSIEPDKFLILIAVGAGENLSDEYVLKIAEMIDEKPEEGSSRRKFLSALEDILKE